METVYEAWNDPSDCSITFTTPSQVENLRQKKLLHADAKLLHRITANTFEEAMAVHHIKMGWEPYKPLGATEICPNECGAVFYPKGSGECPNCGKIS